MPLRARLVVAGYVGLFLLASGLVVVAAIGFSGQAWPGWTAAAVMAVIAAILADAFHPKIGLFMPSIHRIPQQGGRRTLALTFDDGPVYPFTAQILDILDRHGVKASFFCIGENVQRHPELAREIVRRGHTLGNHTQTHATLMLAGTRTVAREVDEAQATIRDGCGMEPAFFRCPKGYKSPIVARVLRRRRLRLAGYGYPIWDVQNPPPEELVARVLERAKPGDIIVMHDGHPANKAGRRDSLVAALPQIIDGLLAKDLHPVSLDQAFPSKR